MTEHPAPSQAPSRVECPAESSPAVRWFIFAAMMIGFGVYCYIDHYVLDNYPHPRAATQPDAEEPDMNDWAGYYMNHYGPWVLIPPGTVLVVLAVRFLRRRLVADDEGIGYAGKQKIAWASVTALDASRLDKDGVLELHHGQGGQQRLVLDEWKLKNFRELVRLIESKVPPASGNAG